MGLDFETRSGGFETFPTPDGRYLYYSDRDRLTLRRRDLGTGEEAVFPEVGDAVERRFCHPVEDGVYFLDSTSEPDWIQFLDFETRALHKVCAFGERKGGPPQVSVSPDGRTLIFTQRDKFDADIMLVEGVE